MKKSNLLSSDNFKDLQNDDNSDFRQTYLIFANCKLRTIVHDMVFAFKIVSLNTQKCRFLVYVMIIDDDGDNFCV